MIFSLNRVFQKCYLLQGNIEKKKRDRKEVKNDYSAGYVIPLIYLVIIFKALPSKKSYTPTPEYSGNKHMA